MQTPILLTSLALTALIGVASTGNSQEHAEVITDPAADALASRVEHSFQLNGGLELFGLTAPYETEALGTIDLVDPTGDEVALAHIEAVDTLRELAAEAGQVDVLSLPEPITIRGTDAIEVAAGLMGIETSRIAGDCAVEIAPRRSGRRATFQVVADLANPAGHLESARLDLRGTFSLSDDPHTSYRIEAEGSLDELVASDEAVEQRISAFDHQISVSMRGVRPEDESGVLAR